MTSMSPEWRRELEREAGPAFERLLATAVTRVSRAAPVRTGDLSESYRYEVDPADRLHGAVGSDLDYSVFVELGTSKAAAQPHLVPGVIAAGGDVR